MSAIERAIATALDAHEGQVDKGGAPYILHPLRVMAAVEQMCPDCPEEVLVAAVLHDVIEDSHFSHLDIQQMFGDKVKRYVTLLTKEIPDDLYYQLIKRDLYACHINSPTYETTWRPVDVQR